MSAAGILAQLDLGPATGAAPFYLRVGPVGLRVLCPEPLRAALMAYFTEALCEATPGPTVHILPDQSLAQPPAWRHWAREPGKSGQKDAVADLADARLILKLRSGVCFLQSADHAVAFGPLEAHFSTVVNFINTQVLNIQLRAGWQICHAAAVTKGGRSLAIAGLSGGGKSTSILRMMDLPGTHFVSNDRLMVAAGSPPQALGIPKHPRINPGTILGNPRLHGLLPAARRAELAALAPEALWTLEEKHDLMIGAVYGPDRVQYAAPLTDFWVLNWRHDTDAPTELREADLAERPDLLGAIMKSPGPFYQDARGVFWPDDAAPEPGPYVEALRGVRVSEVCGKVDFDALAAQGRALFHD